MKHYWYFSKSKLAPKNQRIVQTYIFGQYGKLIEVSGKPLSQDEIKKFKLDTIGFLAVRELLGSKLLNAAGL